MLTNICRLHGSHAADRNLAITASSVDQADGINDHLILVNLATHARHCCCWACQLWSVESCRPLLHGSQSMWSQNEQWDTQHEVRWSLEWGRGGRMSLHLVSLPPKLIPCCNSSDSHATYGTISICLNWSSEWCCTCAICLFTAEA